MCEDIDFLITFFEYMRFPQYLHAYLGGFLSYGACLFRSSWRRTVITLEVQIRISDWYLIYQIVKEYGFTQRVYIVHPV